MISQYIEILEKSLHDKIAILDNLLELSEKQKDIVSKPEVNWDEFDKLVDDKGILIERLDLLDDGFESTYNRIKDELNANKDKYKESIQRMQKLISLSTEKSTSLMATESRNKNQVEKAFAAARQKINQSKVNSKVASNYYKAMSKVNFIDPQLMDKKK